ncbi:clathrin-associated protein [Aureococcus anophagefferens]|uniref:Clathrin-associated protein n=1 Tax=Aureococcus anophagefferens TaxID=44056 RepID=A0ABR1GCB5_AURAN
MINFVLMMNKQGKIRLSKFYVAMSQADQTRALASTRNEKFANFCQLWGTKNDDGGGRAELSTTTAPRARRRRRARARARAPAAAAATTAAQKVATNAESRAAALKHAYDEARAAVASHVARHGPDPLVDFLLAGVPSPPPPPPGDPFAAADPFAPPPPPPSQKRETVLVYKRYVGLYVIMGVDRGDNEHLAAAAIHFFVELLDKYFGTVRELDLIYEFESCYRILDEFIFAGEV